MKTLIITIFVMGAILFGYHQVKSMDKGMDEGMDKSMGKIMDQGIDKSMTADMKTPPNGVKSAVFAGGCFWCVESDFEKAKGVIEAVSGYTGGRTINPTYEEVSAGQSHHLEAVKVMYDPATIRYEDLLEVFWRHIDPTDADGSFVDRGAQYRSVIFYADETEKRLAEESKKQLEASGRFGKPIVTEILALAAFYPAEEYHQDYYKKNPIRYNWYRSGSGPDPFLEKAWADKGPEMKKGIEKMAIPMPSNMNEPPKISGIGNHWSGADYMRPDDAVLHRRLTSTQFKVARQNGTEPPFQNEYWDHHEAGIYVDIVSGEPLFSSTDKFDSGTGWPSFTRPLIPENVVAKPDRGFLMVRTEVRSKHADSHLGHVFDDGPAPTGLRYCINSAALRFVARADLKKEGYGDFEKNFIDRK